jgi:Zn-dependent peptidase ImmA (M78 family)
MKVREFYTRRAAHDLQLTLADKRLPLDVLGICERQGYILRWEEEALDKNEEAVTYRIRDRYFIFLKKAQGSTASCRLRWTLSHELGHIMLGHFDQYDLSFGATSDLGESTAWAINREANIFAEELLMPESFIRKNHARGPEYLRLTCDVSRQSLAIRLRKLGLEVPPELAGQVAEAKAKYG